SADAGRGQDGCEWNDELGHATHCYLQGVGRTRRVRRGRWLCGCALERPLIRCGERERAGGCALDDLGPLRADQWMNGPPGARRSVPPPLGVPPRSTMATAILATPGVAAPVVVRAGTRPAV